MAYPTIPYDLAAHRRSVIFSIFFHLVFFFFRYYYYRKKTRISPPCVRVCYASIHLSDTVEIRMNYREKQFRNIIYMHLYSFELQEHKKTTIFYAIVNLCRIPSGSLRVRRIIIPGTDPGLL